MCLRVAQDSHFYVVLCKTSQGRWFLMQRGIISCNALPRAAMRAGREGVHWGLLDVETTRVSGNTVAVECQKSIHRMHCSASGICWWTVSVLVGQLLLWPLMVAFLVSISGVQTLGEMFSCRLHH